MAEIPGEIFAEIVVERKKVGHPYVLAGCSVKRVVVV